MSKHSYDPTRYFNTGDLDERPTEKRKRKLGKGPKIAIAATTVLGLAVIGFSAPSDDDTTEATAETTVDAAEANQGRPMPDDVTPAVDPDPTPAAQPVEDTTEEDGTDGHSLRFEAETSDGSSGSITYVAEDFNIIQHQDEPLPWSVEVDGIGSSWDVIGANVSVQQNGSGEVTCRVYWDGEEVAQNTSTGPYSIAMCSLPSSL